MGTAAQPPSLGPGPDRDKFQPAAALGNGAWPRPPPPEVPVRHSVLLLSILLAWPATAEAQLEAVGVPRGVVRIEVTGAFSNSDSRFYRGTTEVLTEDFRRTTIGGGFFPALLPSEAAIGDLAGIPSYQLSIGRTTTQGDATLGTLGLGLALGLTDRLTLFGTVPIVRQRMQTNVGFTGQSGTAGFNPSDAVFGTATGAQETTAFFSGFDAALVALATNIITGQYDADPALLALANQTLTDATALRADLAAVMIDQGTASVFLPLASSQAGTAIAGRISDLQTTLGSTLAVPGFTSALPLPTAPLSQADYRNFVENPLGPVAALSLSESRSFLVGDALVGATYQVVDAWSGAERRGQPRVRAYVTLAARLPTGTPAAANDVLGLGNGDRQTDLGAEVTADLALGRVGARLSAGYTEQLATTVTRRVAPPTQPIPFADREARVRWNPGGILRVGIRPFVAITPTIAVHGTLSHWSRSDDAYAYAAAGDAIPGVSAGDLALESGANATTIGGGITYASPSAADPASRGLPVEAFWVYEGVVRSGGGRVPKAKTVRMGLRVYLRLWGGSGGT